ncbi:MAG: methylenetetrahydrofolate reductase, partial [Notoacmeibacter sp.]|nr:methylenetetrahydrofolate reductase [Notoacmeibacter sp.]
MAADGTAHATTSPKAGAAKAQTAYQPAGVSPVRRAAKSYTIRLWSVRHSRLLEWFYSRFAGLFLKLHPFWRAIGYNRAEVPVKFVEEKVKGLLFDCRMCGQ